MNKICGIYKITNTITGDFYIGSSKNVKNRWACHKCKSTWKKHPNNQLYQDMQKYGTDKFVFEVIEEIEVEQLKEAEQQFIEALKPTYNNYNAISGIYKITNTITGDFYIGSSKNLKSRWAHHKCKSVWDNNQNNPMYLDMQKYGVDKFEFEILEILEEVEEDKLKEMEQLFIEMLKPAYNNYNAKGCDIERRKETQKEYRKEYNNQLCCFNGKTLTLCALVTRFQRAGIEHPTQEAKKYLI